MTQSLTTITKRDGRQVPFDPDEISKDLFAVLESLGRADAFLARELTDGILHFLAGEVEAEPPTTALVAETVVKVVRELGQPAVAQAFLQQAHRQKPCPEAAAPPDTVVAWTDLERVVAEVSRREELARRLGRLCQKEYSLRAVFSRDLAAAHAEGLLSLGGVEWPFEVAGTVEALSTSATAHINQAQKRAGEIVFIDGPEHSLPPLTREARSEASEVRSWAEQLGTALRAAGMWAVVNLNVRTPPAWAGSLAGGPLFAGQNAAATTGQLAATAEALAEALSDCRDEVRIDWHLTAVDLQPPALDRLLPLVRRALAGAPIAFTFDRPKQPVWLAEGIDRQHPALLMTVGLNLPQLAQQEAVKGNPVLFLQKLGSLARMALAAAAQKREFLRRQAARRPALAEGFLLERARVVIEPRGLAEVVRGFLGKDPETDAEALDLARRILDTLRDGLRTDSAARYLDACLELAPRLRNEDVCTDGQRLEAAVSLFPGGTAILRDVANETDALAVLRQSWEDSNLVRVRFS